MTKSPQLALIIATAVSLVQLGCAVLPDDTTEEPIGADQHAAITGNGLTFNGLTFNGLAMAELSDPLGRQLLSAIVSCALPEGEAIGLNIDGVDCSFEGSVGLAPEWGNDDGECGERSKSWVSACVISRVNYLGRGVRISVRGKDNALASTREEREEYTEREGAYFGDTFATPQKLYACVAPGASQIPRVCGPSIQGCSPIAVLGDCDDVCSKELNVGDDISLLRDPPGSSAA
ncbi:hypothetical protein BE17_26315 [Sorangium cellulosum]|uniref:Uncharacterized protein n=1 Tax=Sorangium cellulosum TaxID=56 RepID=A0A150R0X4_SORCE|nr:hypothetical protein BE17_26315 [Sorangium cellulosum]